LEDVSIGRAVIHAVYGNAFIGADNFRYLHIVGRDGGDVDDYEAVASAGTLQGVLASSRGAALGAIGSGEAIAQAHAGIYDGGRDHGIDGGVEAIGREVAAEACVGVVQVIDEIAVRLADIDVVEACVGCQVGEAADLIGARGQVV